MPHIIVGTAGHIDHGKTALVKALTGIDADRLKEEKERGITIDLGFANFAVDAETTIGFVDVPGHERFVKNMLAGIGGIDVVMLVIAADESVMPQTREHLDICSLLRVKRGLTVLTKVDAADPDIVELAEIEVQEFLEGTFLEGSPVLRVSSRTGQGIPLLLETLRGYAQRAEPKDASRVFRLPIDRAFTLKGFGTVVSGTLIAGQVRKDEEIEILPQGQRGRVRGIQVHGAAVDEARAGQRTALNLQRIELGQVERGMVATSPGMFTPSALFDVHLEWLPTAVPLVRRKRIRFHVGTAELMGYAVLLGQDTLEPGGSAIAQVRLERPAFALPGDRFIVRQYSPMTTLGGGEIIDSRPRRHRRSDLATRDRLDRLRQAPVVERVFAVVEDAGMETATVDGVVGRLGILPSVVAAHVKELASRGRLRIVSDVPVTAVTATVFDTAAERLMSAVQQFHEAEPLAKGIGREDLKGRALREAPPVLFRAAIDHLAGAKRLAVDQDLVHVFDRRVTLGIDDARARELLSARFRELGLQAAAPDEIIAALGLDRQAARKVVQLMTREGTLVKVSEDMLVDREALAKLVSDVRALKERTATFGVREFKELTGLSRKFAVPLLEYLDAQKVTRRMGDERVIL